MADDTTRRSAESKPPTVEPRFVWLTGIGNKKLTVNPAVVAAVHEDRDGLTSVRLVSGQFLAVPSPDNS